MHESDRYGREGKKVSQFDKLNQLVERLRTRVTVQHNLRAFYRYLYSQLGLQLPKSNIRVWIHNQGTSYEQNAFRDGLRIFYHPKTGKIITGARLSGDCRIYRTAIFYDSQGSAMLQTHSLRGEMSQQMVARVLPREIERIMINITHGLATDLGIDPGAGTPILPEHLEPGADPHCLQPVVEQLSPGDFRFFASLVAFNNKYYGSGESQLFRKAGIVVADK